MGYFAAASPPPKIKPPFWGGDILANYLAKIKKKIKNGFFLFRAAAAAS